MGAYFQTENVQLNWVHSVSMIVQLGGGTPYILSDPMIEQESEGKGSNFEAEESTCYLFRVKFDYLSTLLGLFCSY